LGHSKHPLWKL